MKGATVFLSLSGGVDSATLHAVLRAKHMVVAPVFFAYPSKHNKMEYAAAKRIAAHYGAPLTRIDLRSVFLGARSALLQGGEAIPTGEYTQENLAKTIVPGRNTVFIAALASLAESAEGNRVYVALGVHGGDHAVYPDCRPDYIASIRRAIRLSTQGKVHIIAPFVHKSKADIVRLGLDRQVPYALTRSCYNGGDAPCRVCPTCRAREEAFAAHGLADPLLRLG